VPRENTLVNNICTGFPSFFPLTFPSSETEYDTLSEIALGVPIYERDTYPYCGCVFFGSDSNAKRKGS